MCSLLEFADRQNPESALVVDISLKLSSRLQDDEHTIRNLVLAFFKRASSSFAFLFSKLEFWFSQVPKGDRRKTLTRLAVEMLSQSISQKKSIAWFEKLLAQLELDEKELKRELQASGKKRKKGGMFFKFRGHFSLNNRF